MVDWSTLPSDLLIAIALKLYSIHDLLYFSSVCRSWNDVFTIIKREINNSATPWLLLADPNPELNDRSCRRKILEFNNVKCLDLKIPQAYRRRCFGSAYGWIVMIGLDDRQVSLFNPITKAELTLPCLASLPVLRNSSMRYEIMGLKSTILKAIVLKIDDNDFVVMVIYNNPLSDKKQLALSRPGDKTWRWTKVITSLEEIPPDVIDVLNWNGLVLILQLNGLITSCEISAMVNFSPSSPVYANKPYHSILFPKFFFIEVNHYWDRQVCYMVELAGDLLLVIRYKAWDYTEMYHYYTYDFKVYKLDRSGNKKRCWTNVEDLGDYMVFVGNSSAMSVHKSKLPNCQHNAIYFTTNEIFWNYREQRRQDIGMFDMASREFKRSSEGNDKIYAWFMPKF